MKPVQFTDASAHKIGLADGRSMPWRNGGGVTTELHVEPLVHSYGGDETGAERPFLYRVSVALVATSGAFSRYDGYDRHIVLVDGERMTLDCAEHGSRTLNRGVPQSFSGDWDVRGELVSGPVRDFNVIVKRTHARSSMTVRWLHERETLECPPQTVLVVHMMEGAVEGARLHDTWIAVGPLSIEPTPRAHLVIARIDLFPDPGL